jgi:hypothetical protein
MMNTTSSYQYGTFAAPNTDKDLQILCLLTIVKSNEELLMLEEGPIDSQTSRLDHASWHIVGGNHIDLFNKAELSISRQILIFVVIQCY